MEQRHDVASTIGLNQASSMPALSPSTHSEWTVGPKQCDQTTRPEWADPWKWLGRSDSAHLLEQTWRRSWLCTKNQDSWYPSHHLLSVRSGCFQEESRTDNFWHWEPRSTAMAKLLPCFTAKAKASATPRKKPSSFTFSEYFSIILSVKSFGNSPGLHMAKQWQKHVQHVLNLLGSSEYPFLSSKDL